MKKNKNIKNKNLKLSNFIMKLGMVSTVAGTVAASVGVSQIKKLKEVTVVAHDLRTTSQESADNTKISTSDKISVQTDSKTNLILNSKIKSDIVSASPSSPMVNSNINNPDMVISHESIVQSPQGIQEAQPINYNIEITHDSQFSISKSSLANTPNEATMVANEKAAPGASFSSAIFEDSNGTLWLADGGSNNVKKSTNGGQKWEIVTNGIKPSPSGFAAKFFEDSHHTLWVSLLGAPLQKLLNCGKNGEQWIGAGPGSLMVNAPLSQFFEDRGGNLWVMGSQSKLQKYDYSKDRWTIQEKSTTGSEITDGWSKTRNSIFEDSKNTIWAFQNHGSLQYLENEGKNGEKWIVDKSQTDVYRGNIFEDSHHVLWATGGKNDGIKKSINFKDWLSGGINSDYAGQPGVDIFEDSRGVLWSISNTGIFKYDRPMDTWNKLTTQQIGTTAFGTSEMYEDSHGYLWVSGWGAQLWKSIDGGNQWIEEKTNFGLSGGADLTFLEDSRGTIWIQGKDSFLSAKAAGSNTWIANDLPATSTQEVVTRTYSGSIKIKSTYHNGKMFLNFSGLNPFSSIPGLGLECRIDGTSSYKPWKNRISEMKAGTYEFRFVNSNAHYKISSGKLPDPFSIEVREKAEDVPMIDYIIKQPLKNGDDGIMGYGKFINPTGVKLQVSENGGVFKNANENGYSASAKSGSLSFRWKLDNHYYWLTKKEFDTREIVIGTGSPVSSDIDKNYEDIIESKVQHIFKDVNFDFEDWTADSFNALKSNTIKHIKLSNSANDLTADLEVQIHADSEHKLSYKILKIQYDTKGSKISSDFYPVITKELMGAKGYITPSDDLSTQQEVQDKVLANTKKELTDALSKITFDKVNDTAYQALVKNLPATWNPASEKFTSSHQDYKIEVKKSVDSKNGKILLKFSVFQNGSTSPVAKDQIIISGFLGLSQLEKQQLELTKAIKDIADKTFGVDEITTGVFNADLNKITKKITIDGYAKTKAELTVHIKASADDKISYTVDPNVILKDANTNIKENIAKNTYNTIKSWKDDITLNPGFLSFADIKKLVTDKAIKDKMDSEYKTFALSTKISIKINANYNLELVLDTSVASTSELRYVISNYELKYNGNSLPEAQKSSELQTLLGTGKKIPVSTSVATTFPALVEMSTIASSPIDDYIVDKFKYFDFQDWTVDSFNAQPSNKTRTITIYGKNDNVAYVTIEVKATSENKLSYKVTKTEVKINNVVQTGPAFTSILDAFGKQTGTIDTPESLRTEKEAQLKAADKAKDDMRIAIDKMTFDKAELPSESELKVFAGWKGQDKYETYHQEFDVTYNQVAKDSTGEIIVTSTVAPFTKTGPKKCTPESVTNTVSGFMGITQLTNMQSKVKQAILDEFAKQHLNELTSYFFNKDPKNNVMKVAIGGFGDTTAELTLKLDATADDKLSYTVTDVVVKNGIKVVPDSIAGNAISELKKWTGDVDLNPGFLTEEEYEKNLVIKNFKANLNELASEVINAKNTGVSKAVKGEYEFENPDFRIDYTPDDESGEVLGKVTRKGSSSNVQETISGFLKFKTFADAVTTKDLESKLLSALDKYEDSKTFNFKINDDYALELTVTVLPKDDNTISYSVSGFDVKHSGKSLSDAQNSATLKALLKMKGDIKIPETNTKLLDVIYEKLHGKSRRLDMSQLTKATSIPKPAIDLNEVTKELGEFYVSGEQSGSAKLLEENNAPDATGFEFEFQVINDKKPLSEPTKTLPVNLKNGEHVKITSVLKDGYQVKGKMPEKDIPVANLKEDKSIDAAKLTKATEIKEIPEIKEVPKIAKPASKSNGLMIGLVVAGSATGLILIGLIAFMVAKKRKKRS